MLRAYFATLVKHCTPFSSFWDTKRWGRRQRPKVPGQQYFCVGLPLLLMPGLPQEVPSSTCGHSMGTVGAEGFSLLLVTSLFPSRGGLKDVLGAGNRV